MYFARRVYGPDCCQFWLTAIPLPQRVSAAFAKRLKQARELRGLSQRALGAILDKENKNRGAVRINRYEQKVNLASLETAGELAKALNVPLAFLFAESDDLAEWILAYDRLEPAERAKALADLTRKFGSRE
jgi:transcriptional regulator with XRE-family HTH domain